MSSDLICVYYSKKGTLSVQHIHNLKTKFNKDDEPTHVQGWCDQIKSPKTLLTNRIIDTYVNIEDANKHFEEFARQLEAEGFEFTVPNPVRLSSPDTFDICFTGFLANDKESLTSLAEQSNMIVRKSVTKHLDMLCYGYNAGPTKLEMALEQGVMILSKNQFETFLETGEIPEDIRDDIVQQAQDVFKERKKGAPLTQDELLPEINEQLVGLREVPRRESLIALFDNGVAQGWKFHVTEPFKEALDIKLTPLTVHKQTYQSWTQGHAFSFKRGDTLYSHAHLDWKNFLQHENGVALSVKHSTPAGFEDNKKLTGKFTGTYYRSKAVVTAKQIEDGEINVTSQTYDSGTLTVEVLKVKQDKSGVEIFDTLSISQVDFVALLQHGYYWKKPKTKYDKTTIEKVILIP